MKSLNERIADSLGEVFGAERLFLAFGLDLLNGGANGGLDLSGEGGQVITTGAETGFFHELLDLAGDDEYFGHFESSPRATSSFIAKQAD